ncbi:FhaA domain-containing protein [Streptomyces coeruleorubidus]
MGALSALEETLENRWEALWARVLDKEPVEVLDALRHACDDNAVVCRADRIMVPNAYDVELSGSWSPTPTTWNSPTRCTTS